MPEGAYSKACLKLSSLARRACCSRSSLTSARCIFARRRALLMAIAAWNAYIWSASRPHAPGSRPLRGRSTDRTPISSPHAPPGTPGVYIGAKSRSAGCHSSSKRGAGPSVYHCGTSSSSRTQPSVCGMKTRSPHCSPMPSRRSHDSREPTRPVMRASAAGLPAKAATTRSPSGRTRLTHASSKPRPVTTPSATVWSVSARLRAVFMSAMTWCSFRRVARRTYGSDSVSMLALPPRPRSESRVLFGVTFLADFPATESQRAAHSVHRVNN